MKYCLNVEKKTGCAESLGADEQCAGCSWKTDKKTV